MGDPIDEYINKQLSPQKEICRNLRAIILEVIPGISEEMRWGVPVYSNGRYYIGALKDHVNLGFSLKGLTEKERAWLEGTGKTMRHIKIWTLQDLDDKNIVDVIKQTWKRYQ